MKILVDTFETLTDKRIVRRASARQRRQCKSNLDTPVQPPQGSPNTCLARPACAAVTGESYPLRGNTQGGDFLGHSSARRASNLLNRPWWRENHLFFDCSHSKLVPCATMGGRGGQRELVFTPNRIARKGAGDRWDTAETPAYELSVNEAHAHSANAKAGQTPAQVGADRRRNCHKRITSCELAIKVQAVQVGARAVGRKSHPEKVAAFPPDLTPEISPPGQEDGVRVPFWTPQAVQYNQSFFVAS